MSHDFNYFAPGGYNRVLCVCVCVCVCVCMRVSPFIPVWRSLMDLDVLNIFLSSLLVQNFSPYLLKS